MPSSNQHNEGKWIPKEETILRAFKDAPRQVLIDKLHNKRTWTSIAKKMSREGINRNRTLKIEMEVKEMNLEKTKLKELLEEISRRGFQSVRRKILMDRKYNFPKQLKPFKIGVVSDTHFGSQEQQITLLHEAYRIMKEQGIKKVFNAGDVVEGNGRLYRGQLFEMFLHGSDSMVDYTIENYPKVEGITTYIIGGSHDYSFYKESGKDVLKEIAEKRKDIKYLGMFGAFINIGKIKIYLMHGSGGNAYARSYKMQKIIEQFPPQQKPHILLLGHYHTTAHLPWYRNVSGFQLPCFQAQTTYLRGKGLSPDIGFLILEIFPDTKGISHIIPDWRPFFKPVEGNY